MPTTALVIALFMVTQGAQGTTPAPPPQTTTPTPPRRTILEVRVTDRMGAPLEGAHVRAEGPLGREGATDRNGVVTFRNLTAGTYRFRIERQGFIALEKEVIARAGALGTVEAALNAAPAAPAAPAPPAPTPPPAATPAPPPPVRAVTLAPGEPRIVSVPDLAEAQLAGREPVKESAMGCSGASASRLIVARDPIAAHRHADADEMLYVVAGEATLKLGSKEQSITSGWFAVVPRGMDHSLTRRGRNPVILLSILSGPPCPDQAPRQASVR